MTFEQLTVFIPLESLEFMRITLLNRDGRSRSTVGSQIRHLEFFPYKSTFSAENPATERVMEQ